MATSRKAPAAPAVATDAEISQAFTSLEFLLVDLVSIGGWNAPADMSRVEVEADALAGVLPIAAANLRRWAFLGRDRSLSEEEKNAELAELIGRLWAVVKHGRLHLAGKRAPGETQEQADAVREETLGRPWQPDELRVRDEVLENLTLLELAHERIEAPAAGERIELSHFLELSNGLLCHARASGPLKGKPKGLLQPSRTEPIRVAEAFGQPGLLDLRISWEAGTEEPIALRPAHLKSAYSESRYWADFSSNLDQVRGFWKHPLIPRQAVVFLRCRRIGTVAERVVMEDVRGTRIEAVDRRKDSSNVANLVRAAGMFLKDQPAVLCRLFLRAASNTIAAEPLALLTSKHHLRLGL